MKILKNIRPIFKRLVFKIKSLYNKYKDWKSGIYCPKYVCIRLKLGQKLQDGDILHHSPEVIYIVGNPACKVKSGTIINDYLLSFNPTRKIKIDYAR